MATGIGRVFGGLEGYLRNMVTHAQKKIYAVWSKLLGWQGFPKNALAALTEHSKSIPSKSYPEAD